MSAAAKRSWTIPKVALALVVVVIASLLLRREWTARSEVASGPSGDPRPVPPLDERITFDRPEPKRPPAAAHARAAVAPTEESAPLAMHLGGRVVDESNHGVAHAALRVFRVPPDRSAATGEAIEAIEEAIGRDQGPGERVAELVCDAAGGFEVDLCLPRSQLQIEALCEGGSGSRRVDGPRGGGVIQTVVTVHPTATLCGRVIDDAGCPLADVRVAALPGLGVAEAELGALARGAEVVITGRDGTFRLSRVPPGDVLLAASPVGRPMSLRLIRAPISGSVEVRLETGRIWIGTVRNASTGAPVKGAEIAMIAGCLEEGQLARARSGPDGRFAFLGPSIGGPVRTTVRHPDFVAWSDHFGRGLSLDAENEIELDPGCEIELLAVDAGGDAVAGVPIRLSGKSGMVDECRTTDAAGRVTFSRLTSGLFLIQSLAPGLSIETEDQVIALCATEPWTRRRIRFTAGLGVTGRLERPDGSPLPGIEVFIVEANDSGPATLHRATSDADGEFAVRNLPAGPALWLRIADPGFVKVLRRFSLSTGAERIDLGPVVLDRPSSCEGRIVDADGDPIRGATIRVLEARDVTGTPAPSGRSDDRGCFRLDGLSPGEIRVVIEDDDRHLGHRFRIVRLVSGETRTGVELRLAEGVALTGRVLSLDGEPVAGARVRLRILPDLGDDVEAMDPGVEKSVACDGDGAFRIDGLERGARFRLRAGKEGLGEVEVASVAGRSINEVRLLPEPEADSEGNE